VDDDSGRGRLSFLGRRLPPGFAARPVTLAPAGALPFDEAAWRDTLVVVEQGEIELECVAGSRLRCCRGDVLWLSGLSVRALRNPGSEPAVLAVVRRSRPGSDEFARRRSSQCRAANPDDLEIPK
jgi:hypothetical protein